MAAWQAILCGAAVAQSSATWGQQSWGSQQGGGQQSWQPSRGQWGSLGGVSSMPSTQPWDQWGSSMGGVSRGSLGGVSTMPSTQPWDQWGSSMGGGSTMPSTQPWDQWGSSMGGVSTMPSNPSSGAPVWNPATQSFGPPSSSSRSRRAPAWGVQPSRPESSIWGPAGPPVWDPMTQSFVTAAGRTGPAAAAKAFEFPAVTTTPAITANWWELPATSPSTYPDAWTAGLSTPVTAVPAQQAMVAVTVAPTVPAPVVERNPALVAPTPDAPYNFNALYKALSNGDAPAVVDPVTENYNELYASMDGGRQQDTISANRMSALENKYGQQLNADKEKAAGRISSDGSPKIGPPPSIVNGVLTGRPIVSYDFHGVIQNCRGPRNCKVNQRLVRQLELDALNNDVVIVTAGVPSGNPEIVQYLKEDARVWNKIKRLYNSGSKWEIMADLQAVAHYDDLRENLARINSRVQGLQLIHVDPESQRLSAWT